MVSLRSFFWLLCASIILLTAESSRTCKRELGLWPFVATWAPWSNGASNWQQICVCVASIVLYLIFIAYSIVPELKNLQGSIFRAYVATYIATYTFIAAHYFTMGNIRIEYDMFFYVALNYWGVSVALWLNAMSFNIWKTFRAIRSTDCHSKEHDRKKFMCYALYAWGIPITAGVIIAAVICRVRFPWSPFRNMDFSVHFIHYTGGGIMATVFICNTFMYISTALRIRRQKKDTAHLAVGVNKHREEVEQWFSLYLKLFFIMGGHMILWIIWIFWTTPFLTNVIATAEMIQSFLIFLIFIWKENIRRSLRKKLGEILRRVMICVPRP